MPAASNRAAQAAPTSRAALGAVYLDAQRDAVLRGLQHVPLRARAAIDAEAARQADSLGRPDLAPRLWWRVASDWLGLQAVPMAG